LSQCPVPGCTAPLRSGYFMCPPHWRSVSAALKKALRAAWSGLTAESHEERRGAVLAAREAQRQAIAEVAAKESPLS
jgi:hypothetical protein